MQSAGKRATAIAHVKDTAKTAALKKKVQAKQTPDASEILKIQKDVLGEMMTSLRANETIVSF